MKKISKAEIKKAILAVEAERSDYTKYPKLLSSRRASERWLPSS
jgi:hypothetical protein